jgi:hypothetical protein
MSQKAYLSLVVPALSAYRSRWYVRYGTWSVMGALTYWMFGGWLLPA